MFLFINTAKENKIEVALFVVDKNKIKILRQISSKSLSDSLLILIDRLFKKEKITADKLKKIFVIKGPGPFTAVRIAIATANALAYGLKIPVIGVEFEKDKNIEYLIRHSLNQNKKEKKYVKDFDKKLIFFNIK
ncbi:MAG: tRNA (adenosine(37)-N6)-threonylcarbamoyltransferase complex dimerization subunit type 1 TsaB [Patescibacteria group bacterium]|nr:tRNA (adenosine(37)-N6)-threonylcarbamoyltransferase complex dimerization subunit type 1 TsaB [Patescibacteria group bacterium]